MKRRFFSIALVVALAAALGVVTVTRQCALAQDVETTQWTYDWSAPTTGSAVAYYEIEVTKNGEVQPPPPTGPLRTDGDETFYTITVTFGDDYSIRVRGRDAMGRRGPWSAPAKVETVEKDPPTNTSGAR